MALFPAYANVVEDSNKNAKLENVEKQSWLENSSFKVDVNILDSQAESSESNKVSVSEKKAKKHKKQHKTKRHKEKLQVQSKQLSETFDPVNDIFAIDKSRSKEYFHVKSALSVPKYVTKYMINNARFKFKKRKRYFHYSYKSDNENDNEKVTQSDLDKEIKTDESTFSTTFKNEEDMSQTTAFYNRSLNENPHDIDIWLKYVRFQDVVYNFEKSYRKGSISKGLRVLAERKLAILDKALTLNPNCEILLRERLNIAVNIFPADELQTQLKKLVDKEPGNIILWQGYIESLQCSMSHCNVPAVLSLYTKCLTTLHNLKRNSSITKSVLEENIIRMLYQCGLFLKQAGLFEQLWMIVRLCLELNFVPEDKNKFNVDVNLNEKQLEELEDTVLNSQLPLHELWLRIEKLRECCHWLPSDDKNCEDPQRLVFPEDVLEIVHPITMYGNKFKLTVIILTLLKVPLLPCRHVTMQELGLDYVPWALDSVESLLSVFYPMYSTNITNKFLLKDTQKLAIGPQFLKTLPAQEEYLDFLLKTIRSCIDCLSGTEKNAVTIWWLRFQRLLVVLDKQERIKLTQLFKKRIKTSIKDFLKKPENRNNLQYYIEFAQLELVSNSIESALAILTTLLSKDAKEITEYVSTGEESVSLCSLYRSIIETYLTTDSFTEDLKQTVLKYLVSLASGRNYVDLNVLTQSTINETKLKFKNVWMKLIQKKEMPITTAEHFLPNFFTDWVICYGWFLYLSEGILVCGAYLEDTLSELDKLDSDISWNKEILFEFYTAVILKDCLVNNGPGHFKLLNDVLHRAIDGYPNNLFFLSVLAKEDSLNSCWGQPLHKISKTLLGTRRAIPCLFFILIALQKISVIEENCMDTITGCSLSLQDVYKNKMVSIFKRLTKSDMCTRRCGLVWRLYLQFLYSHFDPETCRKAYYAAVEECPWFKALYMDAAIYIPAELAQIQDLLVEKQLRLHVTPEELSVLRI